MPNMTLQVGAQTNATGNPTQRGGKGSDGIVSELQGRLYQSTYDGNTYRGGSTSVVALSANSITSATSATGAPIVGLYNPLGSGKNMVLVQAFLAAFANTLTAPVGPGAFIWLVGTGQSALSLGASPINAGTLQASGSVGKVFGGGVALTGLTGAMAVAFPADFQNSTALTHGTITATNATLSSQGGVANYDGSLFVPPGGVLGLYNTTSSTTFSAVAGLLWNEVPV